MIRDTWPVLLIIGVLVVGILVASIAPTVHVETYDVTVTKTEITGDNNYMVFAKDTTGKIHTFTLNDSLWHGVWNTADMYAALEIGKTYQFRASGYRIPLLSMFPNIIEVTTVE